MIAPGTPPGHGDLRGDLAGVFVYHFEIGIGVYRFVGEEIGIGIFKHMG
jgi:hypothetical protein